MGSIADETTLAVADKNHDSSELHQDVISQYPFLNGYTHVLRGFHVADDASTRESVVQALQDAFDKIKSVIPWLTHQVANVGSGPGNTGVFKCMPWPADAPPHDKIRIKDCSDVFLPFDEIVAAGGPISMLDGKHIVPWAGLPLPAGISPLPVVALQANFIKGGLLLIMSFHHNIIDGTGIFQFTDLLETVLNGGEIPAEDIAQANRDRARVIPLLAPDEPIKDHSFLWREAGLVVRPPPTEWRLFRLRLSDLPIIKTLASDREKGWDPCVPFISSHDALSALYWKCIAAVRLVNGRHPDQFSKFGRAIDVRRVMGVPSTYMGHMVYHAATRLPLGTVASAPLSTLACALRRSLNEANTEWSVRSYATFLSRVPDKSRLLYGGPWNPDTDIGATSPVTAMQGFKPVRFGPLLGESKLFRKPNGPPIPGCLYFINPDDEVYMPLLTCLTKADLDGLEQNEEWTRYVERVG